MLDLAVTPNFGLPYPACPDCQPCPDCPGGLDAFENLARAVDTALADIDSDVTSLTTRVTTLETSVAAMLAAWTDWVPTLTNLTKGSGTVVARYMQVGKTVHWYFQFVFGAGSAVGTNPMFTLPVAPAAHYTSSASAFEGFPGTVHLTDSATAARQGHVSLSGSTVTVTFWNSTPTLAQVTSTAPWTWAVGDAITAWGTYEAA